MKVTAAANHGLFLIAIVKEGPDIESKSRVSCGRSMINSISRYAIHQQL